MSDEGLPDEPLDDEPVIDLRYPVPPELGDKMKAAFPYFLRKGGHKTQIPDNTVGTIMRCACINPTEVQVQEIFAACKAKEKNATQRGYFEYDNFEQQVAQMQFNNPGCFQRKSKEKIMEALDTIFKGKKTAEVNEIRDVFLTRCDKFTLDECSKLAKAAADFDTKLVYFDEYADLLAKDGIPPPPDPLEPINESFR
ncbi:hypothetical protein M758_7G104000 [Ceratodon purpureus]|uniref:Uncharacterized protein n=1 Tax=Ceratodon purpureus TaxID=3225 RepID=A0A8T0H582_CERPU|nr:hypothetical protein KC19_7G110500 [Ceratodon purpureus]KAG0610959.1 hypothetical protein M758_7G104000 [Ceratodon purpureus]